MAKPRRPARKPSGKTASGAPRKRAKPTGNWQRHVGPTRTKNGHFRRGYSKKPTGCSFMLLGLSLLALAGWLLS